MAKFDMMCLESETMLSGLLGTKWTKSIIPKGSHRLPYHTKTTDEWDMDQ